MEWFEDSELDPHLQRHLEEAVLSDEEREQLRLKCPICNGLEFERESGSLEGSWGGLTRHKMVLIICRRTKVNLNGISPPEHFRTFAGRTSAGESQIVDSE